MIVNLWLKLDDQAFHKNMNWPAVPRKGEQVELTRGGWCEGVEDVWWNGVGSEFDRYDVRVELGAHHDTHGEGLAEDLRKVGWLPFS